MRLNTKTATIGSMDEQDELKPQPDQSAEDTTSAFDVPVSNEIPMTIPAKHEMVSFNLDMEDDLRDELRATSLIDFGDVIIYGTPDEPMDIDAALASVADLDQIMAEQEAAESAERVRQEAQARSAEEAARKRDAYYFARPPLPTLARGQIGSVVPAVILIAIGAWLTFTLANNGTVEPALLGLVLAGALGVILLAQWLTSGRWARGSVFGALGVVFSVGVIILLAQTDEPGVAGWPLIIVGLGAAIILSALLSQVTNGRLIFTGAALITAGLVMLAVTTGGIDTQLVDLIRQAWPVVLGAAVFLMLLPMVIRRRG
ncbi:MAG: hypothetical protein H7Y09_15860 [Chitinophagaceae bacterium]|nr:hypothetical protein [Anaerolineae bacterium]